MKRLFKTWLKFLIPTIIFYPKILCWWGPGKLCFPSFPTLGFLGDIYDELVYRPYPYSEKWTIFNSLGFDLGYRFNVFDPIIIVIIALASTFTYLYFINKYMSKFQYSKKKQFLLFGGIWLIFMIIFSIPYYILGQVGPTAGWID